MALQQTLEDAEAVWDALRVVEAVNSEDELAVRVCGKAQLVREGVLVALLARPECVRVYADGEGAQTH